MTTNAELMQIASSDKYKDDKAIQSILIAVSEADGHQKINLALIKQGVELVTYSTQRNGYYAAQDDSLVKYSIAHAAAIAKLHTLFFTLACALQALGENIEY